MGLLLKFFGFYTTICIIAQIMSRVNEPIFTRESLDLVVKETLVAAGSSSSNPAVVEKEVLGRISGIDRVDASLLPSEWRYFTFGGSVYGIKFLYASLTEYVLLCYTPFPTCGNSGRYLGTIYDWPISGDLRVWYLEGKPLHQNNNTSAKRIVPGQSSKHSFLSGDVYCFSNNTIVLEYFHGNFPSAILLPFISALTIDPLSFIFNVFDIARLMVRNYLPF